VIFVTFGFAEWCAGRDPAANEAILIRANVHALAATVGDAAGCLRQQQTAVGSRGEQTPAARFLHERGVIDLRLEAEQRQFEPILPAGLAVAAAAVAAEFREDRHDLIAEVDWQIHVAVRRGDGNRENLVAVGGGDGRRAVGDRNDAARTGDAHHFAVGHVEFHVAGQVL
jgi:hypothetical protein